ncbi:MAG: hypothetical protein KC503_16040, partial [Myxococcales bacterium]|nr:hypothetical protein [Myxococcales bacterium]
RLWTTAGADLEAQLYAGHPIKNSTLGLSLHFAARFLARFYVAGRYRFSRFYAEDTYKNGLSAEWNQHELYLAAGVRLGPLWLSGHYSAISDGSETYSTTHQWAASADVALGSGGRFGHVALRAGASHYDDLTVLRIAPSYRLRLFGRLGLEAELALSQVSSTDGAGHFQLRGASLVRFATASLTLDARFSWGSLYLGGRYGDSVRPANLALGVTANSYDLVGPGLWAGADLRVGTRARLRLGYALSKLTTPISQTGPSADTDSTLQMFSLGIAW